MPRFVKIGRVRGLSEARRPAVGRCRGWSRSGRFAAAAVAAASVGMFAICKHLTCKIRQIKSRSGGRDCLGVLAVFFAAICHKDVDPNDCADEDVLCIAFKSKRKRDQYLREMEDFSEVLDALSREEFRAWIAGVKQSASPIPAFAVQAGSKSYH